MSIEPIVVGLPRSGYSIARSDAKDRHFRGGTPAQPRIPTTDRAPLRLTTRSTYHFGAAKSDHTSACLLGQKTRWTVSPFVPRLSHSDVHYKVPVRVAADSRDDSRLVASPSLTLAPLSRPTCVRGNRKRGPRKGSHSSDHSATMIGLDRAGRRGSFGDLGGRNVPVSGRGVSPH